MTTTADGADPFDQIRAAHHQIGNSLQSVAALLMLQARTADPSVANALLEASRRVRVIIRLHQRLQLHEQGVEVYLDEFLADICGDVAEIDGGRDHAVLTLDLRPMTASAGLASALGLIAAE
ncbi:histidine kinase dimerization/phosphoacceptor domain -containing protein, partial [Brevundimonas sp.]|uniref:histidine kinase dimerization/phosphoacceptor domain -containing protein n=1 Tax=Brevundimonas sp. TaxID=1871086 RepID=UPI003D6CE64F